MCSTYQQKWQRGLRADLPSDAAGGATLLWPLADAVGAERDFHSNLLVFSRFSRGVNVHAASAAASSSRLIASALQVKDAMRI